jgi:hypothetical protein
VQPRIGLVATGAFASVALALLAVLEALTGGAFWLNVMSANTGLYDPAELARYLVNVLSIHPVVLGLALTECWPGGRISPRSPWVIAFGTSFAESLLVGHWGAGESYFLDLLAVASVLAGAAVGRAVREDSECVMPRSKSGVSARLARVGCSPALLGTLLLVQCLLLSHGGLSRHVPVLPDRGLQAWILGREPLPGEADAVGDLVELLRASPGPVLSEEPSFVLAAGREIVGNANVLRDLEDKGLWQGDALIADIRARRFGVVVLSAQRYPPAVLEAIGRSYYVVRSIDVGAATYLVFLPGGEPPQVGL